MKIQNIPNMGVEFLTELFGKGRFATVIFTKKNGELRTLTGKTQVKRGIKGTGAPYNAKDYGQVRIFDINAKGWRAVIASNVKEVIANRTRYVVQS